MKHIKKYNEAKRYGYRKKEEPELLKIEDLDDIIKTIFFPLTDNDYVLEVFHQNGYASYTMSPPKEYSNLVSQLRGESVMGSTAEKGNLFSDYDCNKILSELGDYANMLSELNKELPEIRSRVKEIVGLKDFSVGSSGVINITFNHQDQGYGNLGSVMLAGPKSRSKYHH